MYRGRRLRATPVSRALIRETSLSVSDLVLPLFVVEGEGICREIPSLPGVFHYSVDQLDGIVEQMRACGVSACLLFGIPDHKDACGSSAYEENGVVQRAMRRLRALWPELYIIGDVCLCEYTDHGHCGLLDGCGHVLNDETLPVLARVAVSYARAGADMVAPSDMMDGHVAAIRAALDERASAMWPLWATAQSTPPPSTARSARRPVPPRPSATASPIRWTRPTAARRCARSPRISTRGADAIMVKPALAYLDVIREASRTFNAPLAAYCVSGEYAMLRLAVDHGVLAESAVWESLLAVKRAGAKIIVTYSALDAARRIKEGLL